MLEGEIVWPRRCWGVRFEDIIHSPDAGKTDTGISETRWHFGASANAYFAQILSEQAKWIQERIPKASSWANKMRTFTKKKILAKERTGEEIWGVSLSACDCRLLSKSLNDSTQIFFFYLVSAWNGTRKHDSRCNRQHLFSIDTGCICPGLPGRERLNTRMYISNEARCSFTEPGKHFAVMLEFNTARSPLIKP